MTREEHRQRHVELHRALDELLADYIIHHPRQIGITAQPVGTLLEWSYEQTITPTPTDQDPEEV